MCALASGYDIARFGAERVAFTPRQCDVLIEAGTITKKMVPVLKRIYAQMAEPKWVIAMGDCASCGGVFNNYAVVQGVDEIIPVDIYVSGCPPRPEALINSIMALHEKVKREKIKDWA